MTYKHTLTSCYIGYITQAVIVNLAPLFFALFQDKYGMSYTQIGIITLLNFGFQFLTDILAGIWADKIGFRRAAVLAEFLCFAGLVMMALVPLFSVPFYAIIASTVIYAMGGGLIEVMINPIMNSIPQNEAPSNFILLHSFYCWGQVLTVLLTTVAIKITGINLWFVIPALWAVLPLYNMIRFLRVPMKSICCDNEKLPIKEIFKNKTFLIYVVMMICSGASEVAMAQWASVFAEKGLGVSKVMGDLLGPCLFAVFMGTGRTVYGMLGNKIDTQKHILLNTLLCVVCYLVTVFSKNPIVCLAGCAVCGFSVSIMWPGVTAICAKKYGHMGTAIFAVLAVFGDIGCTTGPFLTGVVSDFVKKSDLLIKASEMGYSIQSIPIKAGLLAVSIFPILMFTLLLIKNKNKK